MISINNVSVSFGGFTLLNDINFHITDKDRIGLVGKNGAGKSTLLKLILGLNTPSEGNIMVPPGLKLGYLPQQMEHAKDKTVLQEALTLSFIKRLNSLIMRLFQEQIMRVKNTIILLSNSIILMIKYQSWNKSL